MKSIKCLDGKIRVIVKETKPFVMARIKDGRGPAKKFPRKVLQARASGFVEVVAP